eukprot:15008200-Alexandrium_andersonii.AAC.1
MGGTSLDPAVAASDLGASVEADYSRTGGERGRAPDAPNWGQKRSQKMSHSLTILRNGCAGIALAACAPISPSGHSSGPSLIGYA